MGKIYPQTSISTPSMERETYTVWLKSLILSGNGCTVYNSKGQIVYRVDNYDSKSSNEFYLMDIRGNVMCSVLRKKFQLFGCWHGYKSGVPNMKNEKLWFQLKRINSILNGNIAYQAITRSTEAQEITYKIEGDVTNKEVIFSIIDNEQRIVAKAKRKECSGVALGNDVLSLELEPNLDHSLIIPLAIFYGLRSM